MAALAPSISLSTEPGPLAVPLAAGAGGSELATLNRPTSATSERVCPVVPLVRTLDGMASGVLTADTVAEFTMDAFADERVTAGLETLLGTKGTLPA